MKMNLNQDFHIPSSGGSDSDVKSDSYEYVLVDLHDIVEDPEKTKRLLPVLDSLIRSQANLHFAEYYGDKDILQQSIEQRGNTFRGFLVYTKERLPIAYAVYYPMVDQQGKRAAYCEDAYVVENFRQHGVMKIVFQELARRILDEGCEYLQWTTDKRNIPFQGFIDKIGAKHPETTTLVGDTLLTAADLVENSLKKGWSKENFVTREIRPNDVNLMKSLNINPNIIRSTGDMPFKGFITFKKSDQKQRNPVCITPGWEHLSTFRVSPGVYLENPTFSPSVTKMEKSQILLSVINETRKYATSHDDSAMDYIRWHVRKDDTDLLEILQDKLHLPLDCMIEPDAMESEMVVYTLSNGALQKMKNDADQNQDKYLLIPRGAPIGPAVRAPH